MGGRDDGRGAKNGRQRDAGASGTARRIGKLKLRTESYMEESGNATGAAALRAAGRRMFGISGCRISAADCRRAAPPADNPKIRRQAGGASRGGSAGRLAPPCWAVGSSGRLAPPSSAGRLAPPCWSVGSAGRLDGFTEVSLNISSLQRHSTISIGMIPPIDQRKAWQRASVCALDSWRSFVPCPFCLSSASTGVFASSGNSRMRSSAPCRWMLLPRASGFVRSSAWRFSF